MKNLSYVQGDVATPKSVGPQIIAHICNDLGVWSGETANRISRHWPEAERAFHQWYRDRFGNEFGLGAVQFINVNRHHVNRIVRVANMVTQRGTLRRQRKGRPIRYQTIAWCLATVALKARRIGASVHLPRIGMDQTGANWRDIETIIRSTLCDFGISVFVYDLQTNLDHQLQTNLFRAPVRQRYELLEHQTWLNLR